MKTKKSEAMKGQRRSLGYRFTPEQRLRKSLSAKESWKKRKELSV